MLALFSIEARIPSDHPLRRIKAMADQELSGLSEVFDRMYSKVGRPSVAPEKILKSLLLMALYSVRSERQFCEQLGYNLLFRWFLDMELEEESFDATVFSKNRERLLAHEVGRLFFEAVVGQARGAGLMSDDHFTVDGTLIEAWASLKSFRPKGEDRSGDQGPGDAGNRWVDFHGEKRSNQTHESTTDPDSRLMRKGPGKEAKLCYGAHALMENRNGLLVDFEISQATGSAEREAAERLLKRQRRKKVRMKVWARIRVMTRRTLWDFCAGERFSLMWRPTPSAKGDRPSMGEPRVIKAIPSVSGLEKGSKRSLVG
jgi:transposase